MRARIAAVPHWYHPIEVSPGIVTPGTSSAPATLAKLGLPADCRGLSVLDVGTRDGYFAFELERRGARVLALDYAPPGDTGFRVASELLGSKVAYLQADVYDLSPETHGRFDVVLFLGVLYHLPDPIRALRLLRTVCLDRLYLETHLLDEAGFLRPDGELVPLASVNPMLTEIPILQFYPGDSLVRDFTNWWAPNWACLSAMLRETGFSVRWKAIENSRALVECRVGKRSEKEYYDRVVRGLPAGDVES